MKNSLINGNLNPVIVIPARMGSTRLPGKPLCDINGQPMIVHVLRRAEQANIGPVVVAVADEIIAEANSKEIINDYNFNTNLARENKIFGSPSFVVKNEIFWGDDRMEDAINWSKR